MLLEAVMWWGLNYPVRPQMHPLPSHPCIVLHKKPSSPDVHPHFMQSLISIYHLQSTHGPQGKQLWQAHCLDSAGSGSWKGLWLMLIIEDMFLNILSWAGTSAFMGNEVHVLPTSPHKSYCLCSLRSMGGCDAHCCRCLSPWAVESDWA